MSRTQTLRAVRSLTVGTITLLPIERVVTYSYISSKRVWFSAYKAPYALVFRDASGLRAVDVDDLAVSLTLLCKQIPGLDALLAPM